MMMNDHLLSILIRQQHEDLLKEASAIRLTPLESYRPTLGRRLIRSVALLFTRWNRSMIFQPPATDEGKRL